MKLNHNGKCELPRPTLFAGTDVLPVGSAASTDVDESKALVRTSETQRVSEDVDETQSVSFANQNSLISGDVDSEHPALTFFRLRTRMLYATL